MSSAAHPRSIGLIAGAAAAGAVVLVICIVLVAVTLFYWKSKHKEEEEEEIPNEIRFDLREDTSLGLSPPAPHLSLSLFHYLIASMPQTYRWK